MAVETDGGNQQKGNGLKEHVGGLLVCLAKGVACLAQPQKSDQSELLEL